MFAFGNRRLPAGLASLSAEEARRIHKVTGKLKQVFQNWGYRQMIPPTLVLQNDLETERIDGKDSLRIFTHGGDELRLRSDITIAVTQSVTTHYQISDLPIQLFYVENAFQEISPGHGQNREKIQAGIEFFGGNDLRHIEVVHLAHEALKAVLQAEYRLTISHIWLGEEIYTHFLQTGLVDAKSLRRILLNRDWPALQDLATSDHLQALFALFRMFGSSAIFPDAFLVVEPFRNRLPKSWQALEKLRDFSRQLRSVGLEDKIFFDFGMYKNLQYYTGVILEGFVDGCGRAILSGGCYDGLSAFFSDKDFPALGFAIDIDPILPYIRENLLDFQNEKKVLFTGSDYSLVNELRSHGLQPVLAVKDMIPEQLQGLPHVDEREGNISLSIGSASFTKISRQEVLDQLRRYFPA